MGFPSRLWLASVAALVMGLLVSASAHAAFVTHDGSISGDNGTGIGNTLTVLILQANGSEYGAVEFDGVDTSIKSGDAQPASATRSSGELLAAGIDASNLSLVLNINQAGSGGGSPINLNDFTVRFYNSDATLSFDADFDDPTGLLNGADGQGTGSSGYVFRIKLEGNEPFDFFASPDNRVGMLLDEGQAIGGSNGGPENFYFAAAAIPEPASIVLVMFGLKGMLGLRRRFA